MPVSAELEQALPRFVEYVKGSTEVQNQLHAVTEIDQLKGIVNGIDPVLTDLL